MLFIFGIKVEWTLELDPICRLWQDQSGECDRQQGEGKDKVR